MAMGLVGRKVGMTRIFTDDGESISVTVIEVIRSQVSQIKTMERDGYRAAQVAVTIDERYYSRVTKPLRGHFAKGGVEPGKKLYEFRLRDGEGEDIRVSESLNVGFEAGQKVDVTGTTKGRGFAGVIKRHHFGGGSASHGNSLSHRAPGSIGQCQTPGRVFKGKKMAGHMGNVRRTVQNLELVRMDQDRQFLLIKGAVPGSMGSDVIVKLANKAKLKAAAK
ncbi:50S ribosomal protein L3 [Candidatus Nitrosoglobus terrae]|uniref:Large ribosomal subunit protein uL3 n=1 Tax=Candidatus Nitrosoglobus terrae TaxID=1630141 RepID=A0A1Q2SLP5_9GAMM|nr:50S ribosomal protein L3 [Candidatus Nitrosoglobus terrae]BAW80029.1 50S ribosomal protein L3 [Candidatus Nitrosoglobus terrae]